MEFWIIPTKVKANCSVLENSSSSLKDRAAGIESIKNSLSCDYDGVRAALDTCVADLRKESVVTLKLANGLRDICSTYTTTEQRIVSHGTGNAGGNPGTGNSGGSAGNGNGSGDGSGSTDDPRGWYAEANGPGYETDFSFGASANMEDGIGVGVEGSVSGYVGQVGVGYDGEYYDANLNVYALYGEAAIGASAGIIDGDGNFAPGISASAEASVSGIHAEADQQLGTDNYNVHSNATGDVGYAYANASAGAGVIYDDDGNAQFGVQAEAAAGAYAVHGEVSGGFTIFGIDVDVTLGGGAGGAEAHAGGSITTGGVSGEVGIGALLGVDLGISVDWSDFSIDWPW
ncbi:MAG: hypothetical protein K5739_11045 [Lachnospiraceae bacterium]|nr:hypothetical protein [Lachnospiraceae bacterium]